MESKAKVIICAVVGLLGLVSAALGFVAEAKRIKASQIWIISSTCKYPSSPALGLALSAAVALLIAQLIVSAATGCFCCKRGSYQSNSKNRLGLICFVISWVTFVNALRLYLSGAVLNGGHVNVNEDFDTTSCYFVKPGVFAGAAVLSLATVVLVVVCYLAWDSAKSSNNSGGVTAAHQGGIAMGHPQFPPPQYPPPQCPPGPPPQYPPPNTEGPVFVHEDTYMRRQFT